MTKPVWTADQIAAHITRDRAAWDASEPIAFSYYEQPAPHLGPTPDFSAFTSGQRLALARIFSLVADIVPLTFVNVADNGQLPGPGNERISFFNIDRSTAPFWGTASNDQTEPSGEQLGLISGSEVVVNRFRADDQGGWGVGDSNPRKLMHEALHTLGLGHPGDYNGDGAINYETEAEYLQDSLQYTVMSYWQASNTGAVHAVNGVTYYASTPLLHDVAALQALYGANMTTRTGDTVYGFNSTAGRAAYDIGGNPFPVFTIWDAGGTDSLDLSGFATASRIDLREGAFTDAGGLTRNISIAFGVTIENAVGGAGDDTLVGNEADNRLSGGKGADTMKGGGGDDLYVVDNASDKVVETSARGGTDTVRSAIAYSLPAYVEELVLTGSAISGTGNGLANVITGTSAANRLDGRAGADTMTGWAGDDHYFVDRAGDRVIESKATGGTDTVTSSTSFTLGANVENLVLVGSAVSGTGNGLANRITGTSKANVLNGRGGADTMTGWAGDDSYWVDHVGDKVVESSASGGTDSVNSKVSFTLGAYVEKLTLAGSAAVNGTGNALANTLTGNAAANTLRASGGNDTVSAGGGNDRIHGGLGADSLKGGTGDDGFFFDTRLGSGNVDSILDFVVSDDTIHLSRSIFTKAGAAGALAPGAFRTGTAAADPGDRIVYDAATGHIYYDPDGSGAAAQIHFATIGADKPLTSADFLIYG